MDTIQKDDYIEFTLIAGENNQYSNSIKGTAEELNLVGWKISDLDFINEETTLEEFKERCNDEFMGSYGSYDEFAETSTSKTKLTRKDGTVLVCSGYVVQISSEYKEIVVQAVKNNGEALRYASEELRADKEFVLEAIKHSGDASQYASRELWADKEFVLEAFKYDAGASFRNVSEELKAELKTNEEFLLKAIKVNGLALEYASKKLRADRDVVLEAVKNNGAALQFALLPIDLEFM